MILVLIETDEWLYLPYVPHDHTSIPNGKNEYKRVGASKFLLDHTVL